MYPVVELNTREIPAWGRGYIFLRRCGPEELDATLRRAAAKLLGQGASTVYVCARDGAVPLDEGERTGYRLRWYSDTLSMACRLEGRQGEESRLTLEPLTRQRCGAWLTLYNEAFFDVPAAAVYRRDDLDRMEEADMGRCGFVLLDQAAIGVYQLREGADMPRIAALGLPRHQRGKGLGRMLLHGVMNRLAEEGYTACRVEVSTARQAAFALCREAGFRAEQVVERWYELTALEDLMAPEQAGE